LEVHAQTFAAVAPVADEPGFASIYPIAARGIDYDPQKAGETAFSSIKVGYI
jgi:hypothetical protein